MDYWIKDMSLVFAVLSNWSVYFLIWVFFFKGESYAAEKYQTQLLSSNQKKWVRVVFRDAPLRAYTIIRAQCPEDEGWRDGPEASDIVIICDTRG
jgi:hypothetical protein